MGEEELSLRLVRALRDLEGHIKLLMEEGMTHFEPPEDLPESSLSKENNISLETTSVSQRVDDRAQLLDQLKSEVLSCTKCEISRLRKNVVFGEGPLDAPVMFVGEAPGEEEDIQGRPFVGKAGKLLEMAINSLGWARDNVYIANILKCRPPGNRNPLPEEISNCFPFLKRQIEIIKPKIICTLGGYSTSTLLGTKTPISKLRGRLHSYSGSEMGLFPTFHPAFILRNPSMKREFFEDLKKVKDMVEKGKI